MSLKDIKRILTSALISIAFVCGAIYAIVEVILPFIKK